MISARIRQLFVAGSVVVALTLAIVSTGAAQVPLPHLFLGSPLVDGSGVTIDGDPAAAGWVVIATNEAGEEAGRDTIDEAGSWAIVVAPGASSQITLTVLGFDGGSATFDVEIAGQTVVALAVSRPESAPTRSVTLAPGWNLVGWTGATAVEEATAAIADQIDVLFTWNAALQGFRSFNPNVPPVLNTLDELGTGDGVWVRVNDAAGTAWEQPAVLTGRTVPLAVGWNLVMWTGGDGFPVVDAVASFAGVLETLFTWDAAAQAFRSYGPNVPSFLNTADTLRFGDGVWMLMTEAATWAQSAP